MRNYYILLGALVIIVVGALIYFNFVSSDDTSNDVEIVDVSDEDVDYFEEERPELVGQEAPDFLLPVYDSDEEIALSDFKGQKVLLNFFASWCPYCQSEVEHLNEVKEKYGDDLVVLKVNVSIAEENIDDVAGYIEEQNVIPTVLIDESGKVTNDYQIESFPTNFFINSEGVIEEMAPGVLTADEMSEIIDSIE